MSDFKGQIVYVLKNKSGGFEVVDLTHFRCRTTQVDQNKGLDEILSKVKTIRLHGGDLVGFFNQTQLDEFLKKNNI